MAIHDDSHNYSLVPRHEKGRRDWFLLSVQALNHGGIPPAPRTISLRLYTCDVKMDIQHYMVGTLTRVSVPNIAYVTRDLDRTLSNALLGLSIPEVILKPEH